METKNTTHAAKASANALEDIRAWQVERVSPATFREIQAMLAHRPLTRYVMHNEYRITAVRRAGRRTNGGFPYQFWAEPVRCDTPFIPDWFTAGASDLARIAVEWDLAAKSDPIPCPGCPCDGDCDCTWCILCGGLAICATCNVCVRCAGTHGTFELAAVAA